MHVFQGLVFWSSRTDPRVTPSLLHCYRYSHGFSSGNQTDKKISPMPQQEYGLPFSLVYCQLSSLNKVTLQLEGCQHPFKGSRWSLWLGTDCLCPGTQLLPWLSCRNHWDVHISKISSSLKHLTTALAKAFSKGNETRRGNAQKRMW